MIKRYLLGLAIMLLLTQTAHSYNLQHLKYTPVRYFTEQDWDMAKAAANEALNDRAIGDAVTWNNSDSGNSGSLMTTEVNERDGIICKTLQIINRARSLEGKGLYLFCKEQDGTWKVYSSNLD